MDWNALTANPGTGEPTAQMMLNDSLIQPIDYDAIPFTLIDESPYALTAESVENKKDIQINQLNAEIDELSEREYLLLVEKANYIKEIMELKQKIKRMNGIIDCLLSVKSCKHSILRKDCVD